MPKYFCHKMDIQSRYSQQIIKTYDEIGSPYLISLASLKGSPGIPFISTNGIYCMIQFVYLTKVSKAFMNEFILVSHRLFPYLM